MPVIARFYGMVIKMFLLGAEHNPPHIHVIYGEYSALFDIQTLKMLEGDLPTRAAAMVTEWLGIHKAELLEMWQTQQFKVLPPLK